MIQGQGLQRHAPVIPVSGQDAFSELQFLLWLFLQLQLQSVYSMSTFAFLNNSILMFGSRAIHLLPPIDMEHEGVIISHKGMLMLVLYGSSETISLLEWLQCFLYVCKLPNYSLNLGSFEKKY